MSLNPNHSDTDHLTDMAIFAAVVDRNGFSAAATALGMSKSNVSRRVALLEARLEMTLLHRTTRRMNLTESGRIYYEHCARIVAEARDAGNAIQAMHARPGGLLNVSVPETLGRAFVLPLLPEFMNSYPDIRLNLTISNRKQDLRETSCDVAIRKGAIEDDALRAVPLGASTQFLYAGAAYLANAPALDCVDDLDRHPFLSGRIDFGPGEIELRRGSDVIRKRVAPRLSVKDHEALLRLTLDGLGVALLPAWMTHAHVHDGSLVRLLPDVSGPSIEFNLVFLPHRSMAPNLRVFVEFMTERFRLNRPWEIDRDCGKVVTIAGGDRKRV